MKKHTEKRVLNKAHRAISQVAFDEGQREESIRAAIEVAIQDAMSDPDPAVQAKWKEIAPDGGPVTPEQVIAWAAKKVKRGNV